MTCRRRPWRRRKWLFWTGWLIWPPGRFRSWLTLSAAIRGTTAGRRIVRWSAGDFAPTPRRRPLPTGFSATAWTMKFRGSRPRTAPHPACRRPWRWQSSIRPPGGGLSRLTPWAGKCRDACGRRRLRLPRRPTTRRDWWGRWAARRRRPRFWDWMPVKRRWLWASPHPAPGG